MAESITPTITSTTAVLHTNSTNLNTTYSAKPTLAFSSNLSSATKLYYGTVTTTTSPTAVTLTAVTDAYGTVISFSTVQHLQIVNTDATNAITVGGGTHALFAALPNVVAGGCIVLTTNQTVTAGSVDTINITAVAGSVVTNFMIVGD